VMSTEDSVYITDMKGTMIFVNKAFCRTYGYTEEEILGQNSSLLWIQKNQGENTRSVFQTRSFSSGWEVGFYHRRKDESIFPISLSRSTIKDAHRNDVAIVGVARDISERILIEDELRTTSLKFKKRNQLHNYFAVLVAETLQKLLANGDINRAATIVHDYLDLSKISADKLELRRSQFNFSVLAGQVIEALASRAARKKIKLQSFKPDAELMVNADYDRMAQVLNNLIHRAIVCSPADSSVEVHIKDGEYELIVEIYDSSPPHGPDPIHMLVNNSEWLKEQFHAGQEDVALGLRIAKELVEMHGGRIWTEYAKTKRANMICFAMPKASVRQKVAMVKSSEIVN
jgi:PAS domain S-box-containing protein